MISPRGARVVIKTDEMQQTPGGILIPERAQGRHGAMKTATVLALPKDPDYPGCSDDACRECNQFKGLRVGTKIVVQQNLVYEVEAQGQTYEMIDEANVLAIIPDPDDAPLIAPFPVEDDAPLDVSGEAKN